jgi:hypothetical protein
MIEKGANIMCAYSDKILEEKWRELEDITTYEDEDGCLRLCNSWFGFDKDTDIENIWYWFDERHSKGVGWLSENIFN